MTMKNTLNFGKVDYYGNGRRSCQVEVKIELENTEQGDRLSICGYIWNFKHTDIVSGGQNLDTIKEFLGDGNSTFNEVYRLWKLYHLNDAHPECEHQLALGWREQARKKVAVKTYSLNYTGIKHCEETGEEYKFFLYIYGQDELPEKLKSYYKLSSIKQESLGHIHQEDCVEGLLCKPCPVCGYKYGTAWKYMPIPDEDLAIINKLIEKGEV